DTVRYNGQECFSSGRRTTGYFALAELCGTKVKNSVVYKKLKLLEKADHYLTERRMRGDGENG
ncbi:MAG: HNH endonuclease, partial [Clostridia bacterium]|nr:HNH endonuclease [Clostridia bacterium]